MYIYIRQKRNRTCQETCFILPTPSIVLPTPYLSLIVYRFSCCCGQDYVGRTIKRLSERIKQHVPDKLLAPSPSLCKAAADSAITRHLKESPSCISDKLRQNFSILAHARHQTHLDVLEALFINKLSPSLCCQKDHVRVLSVFSTVALCGRCFGAFCVNS